MNEQEVTNLINQYAWMQEQYQKLSDQHIALKQELREYKNRSKQMEKLALQGSTYEKSALVVSGTLGDRIASLRTAHGLSFQQLGRICKVTRQSISKWESGESQPSPSAIYTLAKLFNVSADYLLGLSNSPQPNVSIEVELDAKEAIKAVAKKFKEEDFMYIFDAFLDRLEKVKKLQIMQSRRRASVAESKERANK